MTARKHNRQSKSRQAPSVTYPATPSAEPKTKYKLGAESFSLSAPDFGAPQLKIFPPLLALVLQTVWQLKIDAHANKYIPKIVLVDRFKKYRRPDNGQPLSANLVKALATICRPLEDMRGGRPGKGKTEKWWLAK